MSKVSVSLVFMATPYNKSSVGALTGVLEADARLSSMWKPHYVYPRNDDDWPEKLRGIAAGADVTVVAFSFMTPDLSRAAAEIENARGVLGEMGTIIAGGAHPTGDTPGTLEAGVDYAVVGEGEIALPGLLGCLLEGGVADGLPGVAFLRDGRVQRGPKPPPADLDDFPPFGVANRRLGHIEISRGCPWGCAFCQVTYTIGGRMRHRSVESVAYWMERAKAEAGYRYARFVTPNALAYGSKDGRTPDLDAVEALLVEANRVVGKEQTFLGSFPSEVRPENVTREAIALLKKHVANDSIVVGAQSGSNRMLRRLRRGHTVEEVYNAVGVATSAGMGVHVDVIFGLPDETEKDKALTRQMIEDLSRMGACIHTHTFMPLPGSPLASALPGRVDGEDRSLIGRLSREGAHSGQWKRQERFATDMAYRRDSR